MAGWLAEAGHLVGARPIALPLRKPEGTTTYCWRPAEVRAKAAHCRARPDLAWVEGVVVALACTDLRISELAALRWTDLEAVPRMIHLTDESRFPRGRGKGGRETKSGRGRSLPVAPDLEAVLDGMKRHPRPGVPRAAGRPAEAGRGPDRPDPGRPRPPQGPVPGPPDGLGFADGRLHSFRHYFCSTCALAGTPEQVVMDWPGHRESKMVKHYFHLHDQEARRQMRRVDFLGRGPAA